MTRVEAEATWDEGGGPRVRLRIEADDDPAPGRTGRGQTLSLTVQEAVAARDALNRALNDLGLPDRD